MTTAEFSKLPRELREEIWSLALLPEPGIYHFDPDYFDALPDIDGWADERWMISKRRYPTAMHLCQESRRFSFQIKAQEQKQEQENGTVPYYCLGENARPFHPTTDTFWFSKASLLGHRWVRNLTSVIGNRLHIIENLAVSAQCISIVKAAPAPNSSMWNSFRWDRLLRFNSLRRVHVVFAERCVYEGSDENPNGSSSSNPEKVTELRLEKWTEGSSTETTDEVETLMENVQMSVVEAFQDMYGQMLEDADVLLPVPEGTPDFHDGSGITFHAAQVIKMKTF